LNRFDNGEVNYQASEAQTNFPEPWTAQVFALTVHLCETGVISWDDWTERLSAKLHEPGRRLDGTDYYDGWTETLCDILLDRGTLDRRDILRFQNLWQKAAEKTPHGQPILLQNADLV